MRSETKTAYTIDLRQGSSADKREEIRRYFHAGYDLEDRLYDCVAEAGYYRRADPLRHPLIFYFGHTSVFFVNKLLQARLIPERIDPRLESVCAVGVDEMSWDDLDETHHDWPAVADVRAYRSQVRARVDALIGECELTLPIGWDSPFWAIMMGIEHQRIHIETSSVLIRQLPLSDVRPQPFWRICSRSSQQPSNELRDVPGARIVIGKARDSALYGWDNEYGRYEEQVAPFAAARYLVSNGEFRAFVEDGGYGEPRHWTPEGREWCEFRRAAHPLFWRKGERDGWRLRLMLEEVPMPWDWPVEVNYLEAKAFCNWKSERDGRPLRLPTEAEWYRLRDVAGVTDLLDWERAPGNLNLEGWASPCPVTEFSHGGFHDVVGNVWQWTETPIRGFPGFEVHPLYDDFSTPTFDTQHNLIKGGSWISTGNEIARDSRYAFRRHFFQHAGFRYVESEQAVEIERDVYETDALVAQYCEFHWGDEYLGVPNYPRACAEICLELMRERRREHALDLGCAVGRASFELARDFERVTGLDFSTRFIRIAETMARNGRIHYVRPDEGELATHREQRLQSFGLESVRSRVAFFQADACNLKPIHRDYDLVFAGNLLDRLYAPRKFLKGIAGRIRSGGLLVLTSPYTWLEEHTARSEWIGGFKRDGENLTTLDGLREILREDFAEFGEPRDVPFVIRETRRKFQHSLAQLTVWERRAV